VKLPLAPLFEVEQFALTTAAADTVYPARVIKGVENTVKRQAIAHPVVVLLENHYGNGA
jgi:hypothetical protein